jgi:predicted nuclease of predicted toxin-antitoxin system
LITGVAPFCAFLDAGVPDSVGTVLAKNGHRVIYHREVLPERTPDHLVALTALANQAALVALDKDMKQLAQRYGTTARGDRLARLNIIRICCNEVIASKRIDHVMSFIVHEWMISEQKVASRMWVEIGPHFIKSNR